MFSHFGVLDVLSSTTPRPSGRKPHWARHLATLATKAGEKCGLDDSLRPEIVVADFAAGCPSVEGVFVALLNPERGMLLLSGASFPGARFIGDARGGAIDVTLPGTGTWKLDRAGSSHGQVSLWGASYPFLATSGRGCIAFDKQHWSAEGDLVTYLRWLVEGVYFKLPPEERLRRPDFRMSNRQVMLRIERPGYGAFRLSGKEGSTLACRYADSGRVYLFIPFVLDEPNGRVAVKVASTDGSYFDTTAKQTIGWVVSSPEEPGALAGTSFTVFVEGVDGADETD
jgi:hypothetical protein